MPDRPPLFVGGSVEMGLESAGFLKEIEYFLKSLETEFG
jgi:hypothetical protein